MTRRGAKKFAQEGGQEGGAGSGQGGEGESEEQGARIGAKGGEEVSAAGGHRGQLSRWRRVVKAPATPTSQAAKAKG